MTKNERLQKFISWWRVNITGDEKGEAQTFLGELVKAFGHPGLLEVGTPETRVRRKRNGKISVSFADYLIHKTVLIEMKKRGENLANHYDQLENYWKSLPEKPRYALLCNFDEIWIYDFPVQFYEPVDRIKIDDLIERADALEFMVAGSNLKPVFKNNLVEVTKEAALSLAKVFISLEKREVDRQIAQRYVLQCMLALFAEDIGLLPDRVFTRIIEECINEGGKSHDLITLLFFFMNMEGGAKSGRFTGVEYFNGGIFSEIHPIALSSSELHDLREAARQNWSKIKPAIFGTIFEQSMSAEERHMVGAHFTNEQDIKMIVDPVIVNPWSERIEATERVENLLALHSELCEYIVLDPACGSGNFLYIAYIEMKKLERDIFDKLIDLGADLPEKHIQVQQFYGYDIRPFAVELAKVTLMIAKKIAVDAFGSEDSPLPLDNMDENIRNEDALFNEWVDFNACIGNPPYLGAKRLKQEYSTDYVNRIRETFKDVPGNADFCVYWFRKTHELMQAGNRAGLVGTNSIRQNYSREGGLDYIVANDGHIYDAVSSMPWSGDAVVHVSIVCWSKGKAPTKTASLRFYEGINQSDEQEHIIWHIEKLPEINSSLSEEIDVTQAKILAVNTLTKYIFQGQTPGHKGFVLTQGDASNMVRNRTQNRDVIFPYLIGNDILSQARSEPSRFIIDFEAKDILSAKTYKVPFKHIEKNVLPDKEEKAENEQKKNADALKKDPDANLNHDHNTALSSWWQHFRSRVDRNEALSDKKRYIACSRVTKRQIFSFVSASIKPSDSLQTFMFDDDYSFGIISSSTHWEWFKAKGSTLKGDYRYTPTSVWDTFPFPQNPSPEQVKAVADAARELHEFRRERMARSDTLTLRDMYRSLEQPGNNPLRNLHEALDKAVMSAYGFDSEKDILAQLLDLNLEVANKIDAGESVTAPGIPENYPNPDELVSEGCIQPPELI